MKSYINYTQKHHYILRPSVYLNFWGKLFTTIIYSCIRASFLVFGVFILMFQPMNSLAFFQLLVAFSDIQWMSKKIFYLILGDMTFFLSLYLSWLALFCDAVHIDIKEKKNTVTQSQISWRRTLSKNNW